MAKKRFKFRFSIACGMKAEGQAYPFYFGLDLPAFRVGAFGSCFYKFSIMLRLFDRTLLEWYWMKEASRGN